ncbi:MAG: hypothetical protein O2780_16700 [Proteobacteria bacterium]|nr:hypothetical protein [Pseudomonadota bacterium]
MSDKWKIALNREGETYMLFDRSNDPNEEHNLAGWMSIVATPRYCD